MLSRKVHSFFFRGPAKQNIGWWNIRDELFAAEQTVRPMENTSDGWQMMERSLAIVLENKGHVETMRSSVEKNSTSFAEDNSRKDF